MTIEVDNIATIKDLIRKDLGVSILPKSACMDELRKGKIAALPIENLSMARETRIHAQPGLRPPGDTSGNNQDLSGSGKDVQISGKRSQKGPAKRGAFLYAVT